MQEQRSLLYKTFQNTTNAEKDNMKKDFEQKEKETQRKSQEIR